MRSSYAIRTIRRSAAELILSVNALRPISRRGYATLPVFVAGMPVSELPLAALAMSIVRSVLRARSGDFRGWSGRVAGAMLVSSWCTLLFIHRRATKSGQILHQALGDADGDPDADPPISVGFRPARVRGAFAMFAVRRRYVDKERTLTYGPHGRANRLDIWRRSDAQRDRRAPVIIQVPGGAWVTGSKQGQAYPLLSHLAARGWVCVSINYRLSPRNTWPDQIVDVKRAIAWVKANVEKYGGDPDFVAITGGSAGGHLAALAGLTAGDKTWQPGFEDADSSVAAVVPLYGRYDWFDRDGPGRSEFVGFLARFVVKRSFSDARADFCRASPIARVVPGAPPFFVVHGQADSLIPIEEARAFVARLREVSTAPVVYAELPGAQHAFDLFGSVRAVGTAAAIERFLNSVPQTLATARDEALAAPRKPRN